MGSQEILTPAVIFQQSIYIRNCQEVKMAPSAEIVQQVAASIVARGGFDAVNKWLEENDPALVLTDIQDIDWGFLSPPETT